MRYKVEYTHSSRNDMRRMKIYILDTFEYREYGENFTKKMKEAAKVLKEAPVSFGVTEFEYRGYEIYLKSYRTYLFFYIVDKTGRKVTVLRVLQDGMNWEMIMEKWLQENQ